MGMVLLLALQGALCDVNFNCNDGTIGGTDLVPTTYTLTIDAKQDSADKTMYTVKITGDSSNKFMDVYAGAYIAGKLAPGTVMTTQGMKKDCGGGNMQYFELKGSAEMETAEFQWKYTGNEGDKVPEFKVIVCKETKKCSVPTPSKPGDKLPAMSSATPAPGTATDAKKSGAASLSTVVVPALVTVAAFVCLRKFPFLLHAVMVVH